MNAREFFPNMPDEVFETWIGPLVEEVGWPFSSFEENLQSSDWRYRLGINKDLRDWRDAPWARESLDLANLMLTSSSLDMINNIIKNCHQGMRSSTENLLNTKNRFNKCKSYIESKRCLPCPVVLEKLGEGYSIWDGHHRISALVVANQNSIPVALDAWVVKF
jgi:hypothetical protein